MSSRSREGGRGGGRQLSGTMSSQPSSKGGWKRRGEEGGRLGKDLDVKFRYVNFIGRQGEILSRDCILEKSVRDIYRER